MPEKKLSKSDMKQFWQEAHKKDMKYELTGSSAEGVIKFLNIDQLIKEASDCLVIGVGFGYETKYLTNIGKRVSVLDISPEALDRVKDYTVNRYLPDQLEKIKAESFDLIISHLVTQHMPNKDLEHQINQSIRILKQNGTFAMQFASRYKDNNDGLTSDIPVPRMMAGLVSRSLKYMKSIINKFDGKITWRSTPIFLPHVGHHWYGIHIQKNKPMNKMHPWYDQPRWLLSYSFYILKLYTARFYLKLKSKS
jgi:SAM-dependent methyltransferase